MCCAFSGRSQFAVHLLVWFSCTIISLIHGKLVIDTGTYIDQLQPWANALIDCLNCAAAEHLNSPVVTS